MAPFLQLKKPGSKGSLHTILNMFIRFTELYAPAFYNDEVLSRPHEEIVGVPLPRIFLRRPHHPS